MTFAQINQGKNEFSTIYSAASNCRFTARRRQLCNQLLNRVISLLDGYNMRPTGLQSFFGVRLNVDLPPPQAPPLKPTTTNARSISTTRANRWSRSTMATAPTW